MISTYIQSIESTIKSSSLVRTSTFYKDEREDEILFLRGELHFIDGSSLH